jgi:hypothetical protein
MAKRAPRSVGDTSKNTKRRMEGKLAEAQEKVAGKRQRAEGLAGTC